MTDHDTNDDRTKPQLEGPDAPVTNEELHLGLAGNALTQERAGFGVHFSIAIVAASLLGYIPGAFAVAVPSTLATLHFLDCLGFQVDSDSRVRWLLNKFATQRRTFEEIQQTHQEQLAEKEAVADGGAEVTTDE